LDDHFQKQAHLYTSATEALQIQQLNLIKLHQTFHLDGLKGS
jgi:hypothetical protein